MDGRTIALLIDSFWQILLPGLTVTIPLTAISFLFGLIIALFTALVQIAHVRVLDQLARFYVWVIRGTPLLVQLFVIFYGLPSLGVTLDAFPSAIIVFSINTGAYAAETMRAAILSVPKGQMEAGYCSLIGLLKDTSLASNITIMEMFMSAQRIAARTYDSFALYCEVALIYLLFCTILTKVQRICEKKLELN